MLKRFGIKQEDTQHFAEAYEKLFHDLLAEVVAAQDPARAYWPSSPSSEGKADANAESHGDIHHWGAWHMGLPIETYLSLEPRFISEFGFQGMPAPQTATDYLPENERFIGSPAMYTHQKHARGYDLIRTYLERNYPPYEGFEAFSYLSQIQQADYIKLASEHFRSLQPHCMGILYWQFNDCWPVCSWSSVDYHGRWKALHYYAKKFFAPLLVYAKHTQDHLQLFLVSDKASSGAYKLIGEFLDFEGVCLHTEEITLTTLAKGSTLITEIRLTDVLGFSQSNPGVYLRLSLTDGKHILAENRLFSVSIKHLPLPTPTLSIQTTPTPDGMEVHLSSSTFAKNIYLEWEGIPGFWEDNYFDLDAGMSRKILFRTQHSPDTDRLHIRSMTDYLLRS